MAKKSSSPRFGAPSITNKRARYDFELGDQFEAGVMLLGSEVKALRLGQASLNEAYIAEKHGELYLQNATISEYAPSARFGHAPKRLRKLLLKKKEVTHIIGAMTRERATAIPINLYFNEKGRVKCTLALAKGKRDIDKRETEKQRDWSRQKARILRGD